MNGEKFSQFEEILYRFPDLLNSLRDGRDRTILMEAVYYSKPNVFAFILKQDQRFDIKNLDGWTVLHRIAHGGFVDKAELFLKIRTQKDSGAIVKLLKDEIA